MRVAAVDCGTNTIKLLVADVDVEAGTTTDVVRESRVVRLGEGVDRTGRLAEAAGQLGWLQLLRLQRRLREAELARDKARAAVPEKRKELADT